MSYTEEELITLYWWPFPPPEPELGWMYDFDSIKHWLELTHSPAKTVAENRAGYVALSAGAVINQAMTLDSVAKTTGEEAVFSANRSRLQSYVDGLVASPVVCEVAPRPLRGVVVFGVFIPFLPQQEPIQPHWDEPLSSLDLTAVGVRMRAAAETLDDGPLRTDLMTAATRLFDAAKTR